MNPRVFLLVALGILTGCTKNGLVDIAMRGTPRPPSARNLRVGKRMVLAGDMHCHVRPPDASYHVSREVPATLALAREEGLDFVVLTPHVPARFFGDERMRAWVLETHRALRAEVAREHPSMLVFPGFEYTDRNYGHVGAAFADLASVLAELPAATARAAPERFFELWVARGGLLTINHPVNRALPAAPFRELRYDMSWRAFRGIPVPEELAWITAHAQALETYNSTVTQLRDPFVLGEEERSLREASHLADHVARTQHRRFAAVGGSDSHGDWLRATTFVLADERSERGVYDALVAARTCVRGPEACALELRPVSSDETLAGVGDAIRTGDAGKSTRFEARAGGAEAQVFVNGVLVATGKHAAFTIDTERCAVVRAVVGRSWSSGIYVNCF
jgi:hypothetical protein